jgi:hypothetical protein
MDVGAPAVVAAIHDAVGVWITELPATPERILAALHGTPTRRRPVGPGSADAGSAAAGLADAGSAAA